jgi:nitrite reductase/ring-hydroxylating ferredoxin subunit
MLHKLLDAPSNWQSLDPLATSLKKLWDRLLPPGPIADLLHGRPVGHPVHPPLAQAALTGWTAAAIFGVGDLISPEKHPSRSPRAVMGLLGAASALPTIVSGWADWKELHEDQQRTGLVHASIMGTAAALSVAARLTHSRRAALLDLTAGLVATMGAALGGHLAYRWAAGANHAEAFSHLAKEGWSRICLVDELKEDEPRMATVGDEPVVLCRVGDEIYALADRCSHLGGPLHDGSVKEIDNQPCLACPWHGSAFRLSDGEVKRGPAYVAQPALECRVAFGWIDVRPRQLPGVPGR